MKSLQESMLNEAKLKYNYFNKVKPQDGQEIIIITPTTEVFSGIYNEKHDTVEVHVLKDLSEVTNFHPDRYMRWIDSNEFEKFLN